MHAVIVKYYMNESRAHARMEAEIMIWKAEDEAHAVAAAAHFAAEASTEAVAIALDAELWAAAEAKCHLHLSGLGHGSLARIQSTYKTVFGVADTATPSPFPPHVARAKARVEALVDPVNAVLSFRDIQGVLITGKPVVNVVVEESPVDWTTPPLHVRITFTYGSDELEEMIPVADLLAGIDAAEGSPDVRLVPPPIPPTNPRAAPAGGQERVDALKKRAVDEGAFASFLTDASSLTARDAMEALTFAKYPALAEKALERWLKAKGAAATAIVLGGVEGSASAEALVGVVLALRATAESPGDLAPPGLATKGLPMLGVQPDFTGTTVERRERVALREDAQLLSVDKSALARLEAMAKAASYDRALVFKLAEAEVSEPLIRLIHSGDEVERALSGYASPATELALASVRGGLDRRLEGTVLTSDEVDSAPECVQRALRMIRLARMSKVDLLGLIGVSPGCTVEDPLGAFDSRADGLAELNVALTRLCLAWAMAWPPHSGAVMQFVAMLGEFVSRKRTDRAVPWSDLSAYWRGLFRKVDAAARRYATREEHVAFRASPEILWIKGPFDYVRALEEAATASLVAASRDQVVAELHAAELARALDSKLSKGAEQHTDAARLLKTAKRKAAKQRAAAGKKAKKALLAGAPPGAPGPGAIVPFDAAAAASAAAAKSGAAGSEAERRQAVSASVRAQVDAAHPPINGRKACQFHFGPAKACKMDAATCTSGHHGA